MDRFDASRLELALQSQVEIRCIDANKQIWRIVLEMGDQLPPHPQQAEQMAQHFKITANSESFHREQRNATLRLHFWATDAHKLQIRAFLLECLDQVATKQIAGGFSGYNSNDGHTIRWEKRISE